MFNFAFSVKETVINVVKTSSKCELFTNDIPDPHWEMLVSSQSKIPKELSMRKETSTHYLKNNTLISTVECIWTLSHILQRTKQIL